MESDRICYQGEGSTTDKWSKSASWLLYEELGVELNDMSVSKRVFKEGGLVVVLCSNMKT